MLMNPQWTSTLNTELEMPQSTAWSPIKRGSQITVYAVSSNAGFRPRLGQAVTQYRGPEALATQA
jgi:hypothetical protein